MIAQKNHHCSLFPLLVVTVCRWPKTTFNTGEIKPLFLHFPDLSWQSHTSDSSWAAALQELSCPHGGWALRVYEYCKQDLVWRGALTESIRMICEWYHMHGPHLLWVWGSAQILHILPPQVVWRRELKFPPVHEERRLNVGRWNSLH